MTSRLFCFAGTTAGEWQITSTAVIVGESLPPASHLQVRAALIPIKKNATWWAFSQEERRAIFEERSGHVKIGLKHLPPVARRSEEWKFVDREVDIRLVRDAEVR